MGWRETAVSAQTGGRFGTGREPARWRTGRRIVDRGVLFVLAGAVSVALAGCTSESSASSTTVPVSEPSVAVSVVSTSSSTTGAPSTSTLSTVTTEPVDIGDTSEVSSRFRWLPSTPLWKFAEHLAIAMDGIDGRDGVGPGETTDFVEEAAFGYRGDSLYDVWLFFNSPDEGSTFFSGEPLIEVATEDSVVGPVVFYKARAGSESISPAAAMVLVCDDTVQLWVLGSTSPVDVRDEVIAVASFVDCTSMDS